MKYASTKSFLAHQSSAELWLSPAHLDSSRPLNSSDSQAMKPCVLGFLVVEDHQTPDVPILLCHIIRDSSGLAQEVYPIENALGDQEEISMMGEITTPPAWWPWSVVLMEAVILISPWPLLPADALLREKCQGERSVEATWGQEIAAKTQLLVYYPWELMKLL